MHELPLERRTLHGHYSRELPPIVSVDPGDTIAFSCPNAGWEYEHGVRFEPYDEELDAGHALVGPVEVRGAKAGGTLVVRVDSVVPGPWGVTLAHAPTRIEWRLEAGEGVDDRGAKVALAPFLGVLGMPPDEPGRHSDRPAAWVRRQHRLQGARRGHDALPSDQRRRRALLGGRRPRGAGGRRGVRHGDRVSRRARRADARAAELELRIADRPHRDSWIAFGFSEDLDLAAEEAMATMLDLMERELEFGATTRSRSRAWSSICA